VFGHTEDATADDEHGHGDAHAGERVEPRRDDRREDEEATAGDDKGDVESVTDADHDPGPERCEGQDVEETERDDGRREDVAAESRDAERSEIRRVGERCEEGRADESSVHVGRRQGPWEGEEGDHGERLGRHGQSRSGRTAAANGDDRRVGRVDRFEKIFTRAPVTGE
jgi:hypothetical protein